MGEKLWLIHILYGPQELRVECGKTEKVKDYTLTNKTKAITAYNMAMENASIKPKYQHVLIFIRKLELEVACSN